MIGGVPIQPEQIIMGTKHWVLPNAADATDHSSVVVGPYLVSDTCHRPQDVFTLPATGLS